VNIEQYLKRIEYRGNVKTDLNCLMQLHKSHVMAIPFEALDAQLGRKINLDIPSVFEKVIVQKRGGYCYELNHLFHTLLTTIGFENHLISARVYDDGKYGPAFDHMAIVVNLDGEWLVDVGYGDLFIEPIRLQHNLEQEDHFKFYKIQRLNTHEAILHESLKKNIDYRIRYLLDTRKRQIADFEEQNRFKQSSPDSHFVKNRICTIATKTGRKTILNETFKVKQNENLMSRVIENEKDLHQILAQEFDIRL